MYYGVQLNANNATIFSFDLSGNAPTILKTIDYVRIKDGSFHPVNSSTLYLTSQTDLYTMDKTGLVLSAPTPYTLPTLTGYTFPGGVIAIAFDNGGQLYGLLQGSGPLGFENFLVTINQVDGTVSFLPSGKSTGFQFLNSMTYDSLKNVFYAVENTTDQLIAIDPSIGKGTVVGAMAPNIEKLSYDAATSTV